VIETDIMSADRGGNFFLIQDGAASGCGKHREHYEEN
jgi:hypothetical protein